MKEAMFYRGMVGKKVKCVLCPRNCVVSDGKRGFCGVRENRKGKLYSLVFGRACSMAVDPIEKKPLFHFAPGTSCLSIATVGCNLDCAFCQNWSISKVREISGESVPPEKVVEMAEAYGVPGIAYTYTEPTIFYEYAYDTMKLARKAGLYNVWVSNGYTNPEPARKAAKYLDAINVDLKGGMKFYQKLCGIPDEKPIRKALLVYKKQGVWIEVTNLVIPGHNDSRKNIAGVIDWVKKNLGVETPIHFSRFYPQHRMSETPPTDVKTLETAAKLAEGAGMRYVYIGNVPGHGKESTRCHKCGSVVINRSGFIIDSASEKCKKCGEKVIIKGRKWK